MVSFTYGLSAVQTAVFVLSPRESEFMCEPFKRLLIYYLKPLFPYRSVVLLDMSATGFQTRLVFGTHLCAITGG